MELDVITGRIVQNLEHLKRYTATPGNGCTRLPGGAGHDRASIAW